ncbi:MAG: hypothetical protein B7Z26_05675, partial [Asticcacaulis sp. 32-58-5]
KNDVQTKAYGRGEAVFYLALLIGGIMPPSRTFACTDGRLVGLLSVRGVVDFDVVMASSFYQTWAVLSGRRHRDRGSGSGV